MLKELKCEKFKSSIRDKTIKFHEGLNVVLGSEDAANSIGKSTLLLMIDFCFGGSFYAEQKDFFEYMGHHEILFAFEFSDGTKHFARSTDDSAHYYECDSSYEHLGDKKPISELNKFLMAHYFPEGTNSTFRAILGRFMRIHGKDNYSVEKPLSGYPGEEESSGVKAIEELFELSSKTKAAHDEYDRMKAQAKALKSAKQYGFISSSIKNDKQLSDAKKQIDSLKEELKDAISKNKIGDALLDASFSEEDVELMAAYRSLQRKLIRLKDDSCRLKKMSGESELMDSEDLAKLKSYFPSVETKSIEEIDRFQRELINNVNFEINSRMRETDAEILELEKEVAETKRKLDDVGMPTRLAKNSIENILAKKASLEVLEKQAENYERAKKISQDKKDSLKALTDLEASLMPGIERSINDQLDCLNAAIYKEERFAPKFTVADPSHYSYFTPADSGTGTTFKSLILFDIALLKISNLPTAIHDSLLFKNVWNQPVGGIFKEYVNLQKQMFVAIDRIGDFDEASKEIINKEKVVVLGEDSDSLFGFSWAKKKNK